MVFAAAPASKTVIAPKVIRFAGVAGSIPVIVDFTFHQVHLSPAATRMAAHDKASEPGFFGSTEQELIAAEEFFIAERIPTSSAPVGMRA